MARILPPTPKLPETHALASAPASEWGYHVLVCPATSLNQSQAKASDAWRGCHDKERPWSLATPPEATAQADMAPAAPPSYLLCSACTAVMGRGCCQGPLLVLQLPPPRQHLRPTWYRVRLSGWVGGIRTGAGGGVRILGRRLGPAGPSVTPVLALARGWATPNRTAVGSSAVTALARVGAGLGRQARVDFQKVGRQRGSKAISWRSR
jgi:hypothetical protein